MSYIPPIWATQVPNFDVHNLPAVYLDPPFTLGEILVYGQYFTTSIVSKIAIALGGIEIFGWKPLEFLTTWGNALQNVSNAAFAGQLLANGKADDALLYLATILDGTMGTGHTFEDLAEFLTDTGDKAETALNQFNDIIAGLLVGDFDGLIAWLQSIPTNIQEVIDAIRRGLGLTGSGPVTDIETLLGGVSDQISNLDPTGLYDAAVGFGNQATSVLKYLTATGINIGQFNAGQLTGGINTAVTYSGTALSTLLQYLNSSGQYNAAQLTGALNTALTISSKTLANLVTNIGSSGLLAASGISGGLTSAATVGGTAITTLLQYLNGTGQFNAAQLQGALANTVTYGGTALSTFFGSINSLGQIAAVGIVGALGTGLTVGGTTLGTLFTNINSSGQVIASGITGALGTTLTVGGTQLGTLFTNINSSGQLLGPGITGAINTAATVGGTAIGTVATNASTGAAGIASLITNVTGAAVIADVATALNTAGTNAQGVINGIVNGINNSAVTGQSASQAQTAVNNFISGVVNNLQGIPGTFGLTGTTSANSAFAAAAAARQAQADEITRQQSAFNAVFNVSPSTAGNVNINVNFAGYANQTGMSGIMSPGSGSGTNYIGVTSGEAAWQGGSGTPDIEVFPTQVTSDYVIVDVTLGNLKDVATQNVATYIPIRCNSTRNTFVFLAILADAGGTRLWLGCFNSGTLNVTFSSFSAPLSLSSGGLIRVYAGNPTALSEYAFQVTYNGTPVITATDSGHNSQIGASQRYVGLRMTTTTNGQYPPQIRSITYQDNPPPPSSYPYSGLPTAGTKGRVYECNDVGLRLRDNGSAWEKVWGGPLGFFTEPPSSSWATTTLGSATFAADLGGRKLVIPTSGGADAWRIEYRTLTPASNYTATAFLEVAHIPGNYLRSGLVLMDNSGVFIDFGIHYDSASSGFYLTLTKWTNTTTFNSNYTFLGMTTIGGIPNWLRFRDDGSNRYAEYSFNGVDWILFHSIGRTNYITPTRIGWGASNISSNSAVVRLRSFAGVA